MKAPCTKYDFDQGLTLNGSSQYATVSTLNGVAIPQNYYLGAWIKVKSVLAVNSIGGIVSMGLGTPTFRMILVSTGSAWQVQMTYDTTGTNTISGGAIVVSHIPSYIAVVASDNGNSIDFTATLYIDGVGVQSKTIPYSATLTTFSSLEIGRDRQSSGRILRGEIGDVRMIPQAITSDQIKSHYNRGNGAYNLDNLSYTFWHKFNGSNIDSSGNSRTATLVGSPIYNSF
jgi:hypothetical protein